MEINITEGQGIINILSDGFTECVMLCKPITITWPDCRGSISEYYSISSYSEKERQAFTKDIDEILLDGTDMEILNSIRHFMSLFTNGTYEVGFNTLSADKTEFYDDKPVKIFPSSAKEHHINSFYPSFFKEELFYTRQYATINKKRVNYYFKKINKGHRPKIIVYSHYCVIDNNVEESNHYIIDGHHKLEAYRQTKKDIPVLYITKIVNNLVNQQNIHDTVSSSLKPYELIELEINMKKFKQG